MLYNPGYDGYMHAINITTGVQIWDSPTQPGGLEMPQPYYPLTGVTVADNMVFSTTAKSYEQQPLFRGHLLIAWDATTGQELWNISGQYTRMTLTVADGYLIAQNSYDGCVYAFNSGPTATTVTAPMTAVTAGTNMIIQGTVTDQTPGTLQGTPAISDAWMTPWMEYMFMDQPYPHSATGVSVSIDAVDPNGNFIHIGNANSDITGAYSYQWTPPNIPGKYDIIATFAGSNSYYSSSAETACTISSPTSVAPPPAAPVPIDYTMTIIAGVIVIIIAIAIATVLILRKKP